MKDLIFSYNWNNKLDCKCFTTIRLSDKYQIGDEYKIVLKKGVNDVECKGLAVIIDIKYFYLDQLNNFISHLDTGYSVQECKKIIVRMYADADWTKQKLSLILFKYVNKG